MVEFEFFCFPSPLSYNSTQNPLTSIEFTSIPHSLLTPPRTNGCHNPWWTCPLNFPTGHWQLCKCRSTTRTYCQDPLPARTLRCTPHNLNNLQTLCIHHRCTDAPMINCTRKCLYSYCTPQVLQPRSEWPHHVTTRVLHPHFHTDILRTDIRYVRSLMLVDVLSTRMRDL